jgi:CRISPR/Cas system-associated exonuclease Cas4 (RecB family)
VTHIIRTSDRASFRQCRQKWDFSSKIRMNYEPVTSAHYFEFGSAIHAGLEVYYKPELWEVDRGVVRQLALSSFIEINQAQRSAHRDENGVISDEKLEEYAEREYLGKGMLEHYALWAPSHDNFKPVYAEVEFEVPVVIPPDVYNVPDLFMTEYDEELEERVLYRKDPSGFYSPVMYQGRIDLIVQTSDGQYWIIDHKTAARMDSIEWVDKDPQVSSYVWAARLLGISVDGFIMNQLRKAAPEKPQVLQTPRKGRILSVNKQQATTYELYMEAIQELNEPVELYEDILTYLKAVGDEDYFRRIEVHRSEAEVAYAGRQVFQEAIDMLNDPSIYPNPSQWNCRGCAFNSPCLARMDGSDPEFMLDNEAFFIRRDRVEAASGQEEGAQDRTRDTFVG